MTKSELIEILARRQAHLKADDVDMAVKTLLEMMSNSLTEGDRIEIRGFGSFSLHFRPPRLGRPKGAARSSGRSRQGDDRGRSAPGGDAGREGSRGSPAGRRASPTGAERR